ncbi:MAG: IclR family transcriptional regulator [Cytophagales bacterium]|nr:IclR family transcriptional regulator [Rhizobacter sp.]
MLELAPPLPAAKPALVPAVARALALLDLLEREREAMSLARLATSLALPKSSVHGLCNTLTALGYLRRQDDGGFFIGPRVMGLANAFAAQTTPAQEFERLWTSLGSAPQETVILSVLDGTDVVYVAVRNGLRPLGMAFSVGMRLPAHRAATGRAMLAFHDEAQVKRLFPTPRLPAFMNLPSMRRSDLLNELAATRERGYSIDDEHVRQGVYCMAAPVFDAAGEVVAGVGICLQKATLKPRSAAQQRDTVVDVARQLSQRLGAVAPQRIK